MEMLKQDDVATRDGDVFERIESPLPVDCQNESLL